MLRGYLTSILTGFESLIFNQNCIGCDSTQGPVCSNCSSIWSQEPQLLFNEKFLVASSVPYDSRTSHLVIAAKEDGIREARKVLSAALARSIMVLVSQQGKEPREVLLVPIPSSKSARRRRGEDFMLDLAHSAAGKLQDLLPREHFKVLSLLEFTRRTKDQSKLSELQRENNLNGALRAGRPPTRNPRIIVVDDVVTTGSTLREAIRALKERNLTVLGAATACATRLNSPIR